MTWELIRDAMIAYQRACEEVGADAVNVDFYVGEIMQRIGCDCGNPS